MSIDIVGAAFSADGSTIVASYDSTKLSLWDVESGGVMNGVRSDTGGDFCMKDIENSVGLALSPDGWTTICWDIDGAFSWFDARKAVKKNYEGEPTNIRGNCAIFSPDGQSLAVGSSERISFYDAHTRKRKSIFQASIGQVKAVAFSSDGLTLAVSGTSKDIQLWDVASHKILRTVTGHTKPVTSLAFSPDGNTLASSSADGTIRLWRVR